MDICPKISSIYFQDIQETKRVQSFNQGASQSLFLKCYKNEKKKKGKSRNMAEN